MEKLRYNRGFKKGIRLSLIGILLIGSTFIYNYVAKIQYDNIVTNMEPLEATIIDIDERYRRRQLDEQRIYISYEVDGVVYKRLLKTDTEISVAPGVGANYYVGDKISIFYNPENPGVIAVPRSVSMGYFYMITCIIGLAFFLWLFVYLLKNKNKYLVTQEEYEKEGDLIKEKGCKVKIIDQSNPVISVTSFIIKFVLVILIAIKLLQLFFS